MNKFLRKFDIIRFVAHLSIFRKFLKFFHFLNSNLNFKFKPVWYRPKPDQFPPVWSETGRYRWKSNLNSNFAVQTARTGIQVGLTGLPAGLTCNRSV